MPRTIYIDGNNLLHAMRANAPVANVGRETMVRLIEKWAAESGTEVILVFDGPKPRGAMAKQMKSKILSVWFSGPRTADDLLIDAMKACRNPSATGIVTSDGAILHEAGMRRCERIKASPFIETLFSKPPDARQEQAAGPEKPSGVSEQEAQELLDLVEDACKDGEIDGLDELL